EGRRELEARQKDSEPKDTEGELGEPGEAPTPEVSVAELSSAPPALPTEEAASTEGAAAESSTPTESELVAEEAF
ncbi:MAG TPA: hypothetical protein DIU08_13480, partial [Ktedonobacter sp.]|nr:hypothetical protein [Ktedonobacter sp.]